MDLRHRPRIALGGATLLVLAAAAVAVSSGTVPIAPAAAWQILLEPLGLARVAPSDAALSNVLLDVRLPRVVVALLAGAGLAAAGAMMQAFFRNPLADPSLIGVSAGAALGAVAVIVLGVPVALAGSALGSLALPAAAFCGGLATTLLVFRLSRQGAAVDPTMLLLAGIAINALAGATIGFLSYLASGEQLRHLTFWSLGSLAWANWQQVAVLAALLAAALAVAVPLARELDALLLGEAEARQLGIDVERLKRRLVVLTALVTGAVVASCGAIAFVGLVTPHLARLCVGPGHRLLLPLAALLGAALLAGADVAARTLLAPTELPIGILTAAIGAPFFLWLLRTHRRPLFAA
ncbi:MAG TPA: iron ABC transporter permease [Burkholderiaceae bacterium]|nr:iron ABC transporter permease [Burkholderiaceae bacterium]